MKKSLWFWLAFIVAIVLAVYFSVRVIMTGMGHGYNAHVHNISVSANVENKDLSALVAATNVAPNTRAYSIDLDAMNARILAVPGVKASAVRRLPNGNIIVRAEMYKAVALWTDGQHFYPLAADGKIVNKPTDVRDLSHVVFRGPVPQDISEITRAAHELVGHLNYMEWIENRRWNLHTNNGITVMLPEENPLAAIGALIALNSNHKILDKDITLIDMRDDARILVK